MNASDCVVATDRKRLTVVKTPDAAIRSDRFPATSSGRSALTSTKVFPLPSSNCFDATLVGSSYRSRSDSASSIHQTHYFGEYETEKNGHSGGEHANERATDGMEMN